MSQEAWNHRHYGQHEREAAAEKAAAEKAAREAAVSPEERQQRLQRREAHARREFEVALFTARYGALARNSDAPLDPSVIEALWVEVRAVAAAVDSPGRISVRG